MKAILNDRGLKITKFGMGRNDNEPNALIGSTITDSTAFRKAITSIFDCA
jgi:hypothetical protein